VVQGQSEKTVETGGQQTQMPFLSLGNCGRVLELLRLVQEAAAPARLKLMMEIP
jgi:hypothetical protein